WRDAPDGRRPALPGRGLGGGGLRLGAQPPERALRPLPAHQGEGGGGASIEGWKTEGGVPRREEERCNASMPSSWGRAQGLRRCHPARMLASAADTLDGKGKGQWRTWK